jgi:uncharacterized protein (DUF433 family)
MILAPGVEKVRGRCCGKPVIAGTRLTTATIMTVFMDGCSIAALGELFPWATTLGIEAAIRYEMRLGRWTPRRDGAAKRLPKPRPRPVDPTTKYRARTEPFRSRWYRLHKKHLLAMKERRFYDACVLADKKYEVFLACEKARTS